MSYDNNNVIITILKNELIKVSPNFSLIKRGSGSEILTKKVYL